jgi:nucleotide-binding universal stress UspA family protein
MLNILLAVDDSGASEKAVAFVGEIFGQRVGGGFSVTLLHVIESLPEFVLTRAARPGTGTAFREVVDEWQTVGRDEGEQLLNEKRQSLLNLGIPQDALQTKLVVKDALPEAKKVVAALAIIEEMKAGPYSAVCLGRRGATAAAGSFLGSVAEKVLREAEGTTVWVVD